MKVFNLEVFENEGDNISISQVDDDGVELTIEVSLYQVPILTKMLKDMVAKIDGGVNK